MRHHIAALSHADGQLYKALAREAVQLARAAGLDEGKAVQLEEMLRQPEPRD